MTGGLVGLATLLSIPRLIAGPRRILDVGVTRSPSSAWVTQQLREATAWGEGPAFLIRDHDAK